MSERFCIIDGSVDLAWHYRFEVDCTINGRWSLLEVYYR